MFQWIKRYIIPDPNKKGRTFRSFVNALKYQGYQVDWRELRACDYGAPTIRKRLFLIARCDGKPIVWPKPTHGDPKSLEVQAGKLKPWRAASEIIDWSLPCSSIFERKKPLADKTMKRIARGIQRFIIDSSNPFIVPNGQSAAFIARQFGQSIGHSMNDPLGTITAGGGGKSQLTTAFLAKHYGGNYTGPGTNLNDPLSTITVDHNALITSHIIKLRGTNLGHPTDELLHTITAGGTHLGEVRAFLIKYYGTDIGQSVSEPLHTIVTKDRFGLVTIKGEDYQIIDIGMRMLQPHELFAAQGFPADYIINCDSNGKAFSKAVQVAKCGNSVSPVLSEALTRANLPEYCQIKKKKATQAS